MRKIAVTKQAKKCIDDYGNEDNDNNNDDVNLKKLNFHSKIHIILRK